MCGRYVSPEEAEIERLDPQISDPVQAMSAALAKSVIEVEHHVVSNRVNTAATDDRQLIEKENLQR